jgi:hypothetical protein
MMPVAESRESLLIGLVVIEENNHTDVMRAHACIFK